MRDVNNTCVYSNANPEVRQRNVMTKSFAIGTLRTFGSELCLLQGWRSAGAYTLILTVIIAFAVACGCSIASTLPASEWRKYQSQADNNAVFDLPNWRVSWRKAISGRINGGLSIVGDTLYVEGFDRKLYAIEATTGAERWEASLSNIAMNTPLVVNGKILVGTGSSEIAHDVGRLALVGIPGGDHIYAFDARAGLRIWEYATPGEAMPTGLAVTLGAKEAFLFSTGDGHARALDAETGTLLWQALFPGYATMGSIVQYGDLAIGTSQMTPRFNDEAVKTMDPGMRRYKSWTWAIHARNGQFAWLSPYGWGDATPTIGNGIVFVEDILAKLPTPAERKTGNFPAPTVKAVVDAISASNGKLLWQYTDPADYGPLNGAGSGELATAGLYRNGVFYCSLQFSESFAAFDALSGRLIWRAPTKGFVKMGAVEKDGLLYFGDNAGYFYVVLANTGNEIATTRFPQVFGASPPVIVGSTLFVANGESIYALPLDDLRTGITPDQKAQHSQRHERTVRFLHAATAAART